VCIDAITHSSVLTSLAVSAPQWKVRVNRSGIYVIFDGPGFDALTTQLVPAPGWPPPVSFEVTLLDPNRRYLSRRAQVKAPLTVPTIPPSPGGVVPNPAVAAALADPTTVFCPQPVTLYPAPSAPVGPDWSTIHASVTSAGSAAQPLPWAVVRVTRQSDGTVLATGVSALNGEALLAVVGLSSQVNTSGTGPVTTPTVAATVTAYFDRSILTRPPGWISNPDDILSAISGSSLASASQHVQLGPGQETNLSFAITL
jgi:hypothetical protein